MVKYGSLKTKDFKSNDNILVKNGILHQNKCIGCHGWGVKNVLRAAQGTKSGNSWQKTPNLRYKTPENYECFHC